MRALPSIYMVLGAAGQLGKLPGYQDVWKSHLLLVYHVLLIDCLVTYQAYSLPHLGQNRTSQELNGRGVIILL